ncbi:MULTISPECIES: group III truncated hemoglobin [Sphingobacterium]|uniref:Group III truncated hemoglobin n=1 Tax=Sphingobacterium populi TaxID=1812824 RepID=A0ABW5UH66_9SPHI|nr:group III truncated hemoglobin [Sphingobacterium sp. CFCC 11742]
MKQDIKNISDIRQLVDTFYGKVQYDELIGPIFKDIVHDWSIHLEKMYRFWQTVLLDEHTYHGSPFPVHAPLPVEKIHFDRWISLWHDTIDSLFSGKVAQEAKWRGERMGAMFLSKITFYRNSNTKPLL